MGTISSQNQTVSVCRVKQVGPVRFRSERSRCIAAGDEGPCSAHSVCSSPEQSLWKMDSREPPRWVGSLANDTDAL